MPLPFIKGVMSQTKSKNWKERLQGLRNYQSKDFWAMLFARPLTILFLLPIADIKWITSNRITAASVLTKLAGIAMLVAYPSYWGGFWAGVLVNLGLVLDNMDGTLARYRGASTFMGYFADKMSDIVTLSGIFMAMAWRQYHVSGRILDLVLPLVGFIGVSISAYAKWVANRLFTDIALYQAMQNDTLKDYASKRLEQNPSTPPPQRTFNQWVRWFFSALWSITGFNEVDIYFFAWLALTINYMPLFTRWASGFYAMGIIAGPTAFAVKLHKDLKRSGLH